MSVLDRLEALRAEATPGPWTDDSGYRVREAEGEVITEGKYMPGWNGHDSTLIAETHNALPALLRIARAADSFLDLNLGYMVEPMQEATAELRSALSDLEANT